MSHGPHDQRAIERLARESQVPVNEVARLYEDARARLAVGARIKGFLGIFALRNVRQMLRQRKPAQASRLVLRSMRVPARPAEAAGRTPS
jgi:hypothetical protein